MSSTSAPYGLKPVGLVGGQVYNGGFREYKMTTNSATAIYTGSVVGLVSGQPAAIAATPTTTISDNSPVGVCVGVRYVDPTSKQTRFAQYLPAGAITAGYTDVFIRVVDDPDTVFQIQASGAVTRASIGMNAALTTFTGSTTTGNSATALDQSTLAVTSTLAMRVVDVVDNPGNGSVPGDAYTDVLVMFNVGVHRYTNGTGR